MPGLPGHETCLCLRGDDSRSLWEESILILRTTDLEYPLDRATGRLRRGKRPVHAISYAVEIKR
jgi:hypothetical protein